MSSFILSEGARSPGAWGSAATRAPFDLSQIIRAAPFGLVSATPASTQPAGAGLVLRGVMLARPQSASSAIIALPSGKTRTVVIGQDLGDGSVLDSVGADRVTLRTGSGLQVLTFAKTVNRDGVAAILAGIPPSVTGLAPTAASPPSPGYAAPAGGGGFGGSVPATSNSATTIGDAIAGARQQIADNPARLIDSLGATATPQGYRVGPSPSLEMRKAGLQPGDMIEKVNGSPLGNVENDRRVFDQAVASGRARVDVLRDGRRMTLSFPLR